MKIKVYSFLFITILLSSLYLFSNINGELKPTVKVSPSCGDITGYGMELNVNGFEPNSNVGWKVVHPETQEIPTYGYFSTNSTGGFEEDAELESIIEGEHTMFIYDDIEHDYVADQNGNAAKITIQVPCS